MSFLYSDGLVLVKSPKPTCIHLNQPLLSETRKRNVDFIIERKNKQIEKLKSKGNVANADEDDDDDDDLDISDKANH